MKKFVLLALFVTTCTFAFSNIIKIKVTDFAFKAKTVNAHVGDTIQWVWKVGIHTTTSTTIPAGASAWNKPMDSAHRKFTYILRVAGTYNYQCNFHFMFGMVGKIIASAALAPGFNNITIADNDSKALLTWKTASSKDVNYFSIQRSTDGDNFTEIAKVRADFSNQYKFTDNQNVNSKYVYYQVELIDTRGNQELSTIQMYTQKGAAQKLITSISPNPVSNPGHLMLQFNADKEGTLLVQLYNQSGTFVTQTQMSASVGLNNGHFHLGNLTPGTYYIVCTLGETKEKHTIIVK